MPSAATKTTTSLATAATVATSGTNTSSWVNLTTALEAGINGNVTWTGSLTTASTFTVEVSPDNGTTVYTFHILAGPTGSSPWAIPAVDLPDWAMYARAKLLNSDGSIALTYTANCTHLDSIG